MRGFCAAIVVVVDAETGDDARTKALDDRVRTLREREERGASLRVLEVDRRAALVAVHCTKERRHRSRAIPEIARVIAGARVLDLDDVGAEIGQIKRAHRPGQEAREVENPEPRQRSSAHGVVRAGRRRECRGRA